MVVFWIMQTFCLVGGYKTFERNMLPYSSLKKKKVKGDDRFSTIFGYRMEALYCSVVVVTTYHTSPCNIITQMFTTVSVMLP